MNTLFYPESIVVVGVSEERRNLGRNIVENLERFRFSKPLYLVGHDGGRLKERTIHRRIEDLEETPDLAVFLIPAKHIPDALEACGRKGIRYAVIETAGFNEFGGEGDELGRKLLDTARKWGIRFVGPNCISIINLENGMTLPFVLVDPAQTRKGSISIAAQSGGVIVDSLRLLALENLGFNKLVSMGNKMDLNETDFLRFFLSDKGTSVTGLYLENVSAGRELMNLAAGSDKPVVVLKANTNPGSNRIAKFHTAALAGDDAVADAAFRQAGIHRVQNMRQFVDVLKAFSLPPIRGNRLGVVCRSGGQGVMLADATHRNGFTLATFSDAFYDNVRRGIRAGVIRMTNPLDLGDVFDLDRHIAVMEDALQEKDVDGVVFCHAYVSRPEIPPTERLIRAARELSQRYDKPVVLVMLADKRDWFPLKEAEDFPVFSEADDALRALRFVLDHHRNRARKNGGRENALPFPSPAVVPPGGPSRLLSPGDTFDLLERAGLPVAPFGTAATEEEALAAAERVGWPVALKVSFPPLLHKTEADGVRLGLGNAEELVRAFRSMKGEEFLVQKMVPPGREVIVGGKRDPEFGPVVLFGLGGIFVEAFRDVALRVAPLDEEEAERMIGEIRGAVLLDGFRGMPPADRKVLIRALVAVSRLLMDHPEIVNLDINPLIVGPDGSGVTVVDGKIET